MSCCLSIADEDAQLMKRAVKSIATMNVTQWHAVRRLVSAAGGCRVSPMALVDVRNPEKKEAEGRRNRMVDVVDLGPVISLDQLGNYSSSWIQRSRWRRIDADFHAFRAAGFSVPSCRVYSQQLMRLISSIGSNTGMEVNERCGIWWRRLREYFMPARRSRSTWCRPWRI